MTDRETVKTEMFWAFVWWASAFVAAVLVYFIMSLIMHGEDPAAGLVFGGVTFMVVGLLMVAYGPGPSGTDGGVQVYGHGEVHGAAASHGHGAPGHVAAPAHAAPVAAAPVARAAVAAPIAPVAAPVPTPSEPLAAPISERVREAARAAGEAARAMASGTGAVAGSKPVGMTAPRDGGADDLKRLKGVGTKFEVVLHDLGIWHFDQVAGWGPAEIEWIDANLDGFAGRIVREDWVGQAAILAAGGDTEFSQRVDRGEVY